MPIKLTHIRGSVYLIEDFNYRKSSSVVYIGNDGIVFFDSGWTYKSARQIIWKSAQLNKSDFIAVVPTSFLLNRVGGLSTFKSTKIKILMQRKTPKLLHKHWDIEQKKMYKSFSTWRKLKYQRPDAIFDKNFEFFKGKIQLFHIGHGTTPDNVIVYFRDERLVYAGDLLTLKPSLGNNMHQKGVFQNLRFIQQLDFEHFVDGLTGNLHAKNKLIELIKSLEF